MALGSPTPSPFFLLELVGQGEDAFTEFKRLVHSPPKIARSIAAFANTGGGVILIGVDDDRRIVGIRSEKETLQVLDEALHLHIDPVPDCELHVDEHKRRMVLLVEIPESRKKPHFHIEEVRCPDTGKRVTERKVFIREGSHNRAASEDRIALMISEREPVRVSFTERERSLLAYLAKSGRITAPEFADMAGIPLEEARRILVSLVRSGAVRLADTRGSGEYVLLN